MYSGYGIAFDGKGLWDFVSSSAKNVIIFGVDNSSSSHPDNRKNNFLVLGDGDNFWYYWKLWCTREKLQD